MYWEDYVMLLYVLIACNIKLLKFWVVFQERAQGLCIANQHLYSKDTRTILIWYILANVWEEKKHIKKLSCTNTRRFVLCSSPRTIFKFGCKKTFVSGWFFFSCPGFLDASQGWSFCPEPFKGGRHFYVCDSRRCVLCTCKFEHLKCLHISSIVLCTKSYRFQRMYVIYSVAIFVLSQLCNW